MDTQLKNEKKAAAYQYSSVRFALNYYTYTEIISEETGSFSHCSQYQAKLQEFIRDFLNHKINYRDLKKLRCEIIQEMEMVSACINCFQIYEYVLNRLEYKYYPPEDMDFAKADWLKKIEMFLISSRDSSVINMRIQQILQQLPVRYTKERFFHLVKQALEGYKGSSKYSLNKMMYRLRTEVMLSFSEEMRSSYPDIYTKLERMQKMSYKDMSSDQYNMMLQLLKNVSDELNFYSEFFVLYQELVNDLCVLAITEPYDREKNQDSVILRIVNNLLSFSVLQKEEPISEEVTSDLMSLEGRQEYSLSEYRKNGTELDFELQIIDKLLSGSLFASLEEECDQQELAGDEQLEEIISSYIKDLALLFSTTEVPIRRAVMANTLSILPVFFSSVEEFLQYVEHSMTCCGSQEEKYTCKELVEELIEYEN